MLNGRPVEEGGPLTRGLTLDDEDADEVEPTLVGRLSGLDGNEERD